MGKAFFLGAKFQNWISRNIWDFSGSYYEGLPTINGTLLQSLFQGDNLTDENITVRSALRISTVFTCVNVRGKTLASLPGNVFKEEGGKKVNISDHPVYYGLSQEPNDYMTAANFWLTIMLHFDAWGNAYARINRDSRQRPSSYDIWHPDEVTIKRTEGQLYYSCKGETVSSWDMLHFRGYSYNGICGISPILENADTMGMARKLDRYAALTLGSRPPGILAYEGNLTPELKAENKKEWQTGGASNVKILSGRWKYEPIMNQADQTQFIQAKTKNQNDIYGIWQVPPTFAQNFERATFSNAEQSDLVYAKHTVTPVCTNFEKEINMKCFYEREKKNHFWKFNMNGLLRGDLAARKEFYQSMVNSGIYLRNEARGLEDLNGYEGGDVPLIQGAMIPGDEAGVDALRNKMENEVIPSANTKPVNGTKNLNGHGVLN